MDICFRIYLSALGSPHPIWQLTGSPLAWLCSDQLYWKSRKYRVVHSKYPEIYLFNFTAWYPSFFCGDNKKWIFLSVNEKGIYVLRHKIFLKTERNNIAFPCFSSSSYNPSTNILPPPSRRHRCTQQPCPTFPFATRVCQRESQFPPTKPLWRRFLSFVLRNGDYSS